MKFTSLHHHTTYSFLDGYGTPEQHLARAAELGYEALAFTEHGNVSSHFRAERAAKETGVKPIYGIEAYTGAVDEENRQQFKFHLTILAKNAAGYTNLNLVTSQAWRDYYHKPTVGGESLTRHREGLVILSGCTGSLLACTLKGGKGIPVPAKPAVRATTAMAVRFADAYPDYYLEVQGFPELDDTKLINPIYEEISRATGIPLCATMDCHYPKPEDNEMQLILHACGRGNQSADDMLRSWNYDVLLTLPESDTVMLNKLIGTGLSESAAREAIMNSYRIGQSCNVTLPKAERMRYPIEKADLTPWT